MVDGGASSANAGDADAKSDSSLESIKPFNRAEVKPGPGALPPSSYDPLRHEDSEMFWNEIDKYFFPVNTQDITNLRSLPVNPFGAIFDTALRVPVPPDDPSPALPSAFLAHKQGSSTVTSNSSLGKQPSVGQAVAAASSSSSSSALQGGASGAIDLQSLPCDHGALNSFPLTQRLVAAFIDEGGGGMPSSAPQRPNRATSADIEQFWPGVGSEQEVRRFQKAMEQRVAIELRDLNLLSDPGDELQMFLRLEQWKLRDLKTSNRSRKLSLFTHVYGSELRKQALNREVKAHQIQTEIFFIERMIKKLKKNKKARNKYPKLLSKMFNSYKQNKPAVVAASPSPRTPASASVNTPASSGVVQAGLPAIPSSGRHSAPPPTEEKSQSKTKSAKKKKRKSDVGPARPPAAAAKSAASKGKAHQLDGSAA